VNDEESVQYGREAAAVLGNRAYQESYKVVEQGLIDELAKSDNTPERILRLQTFLAVGRAYRKYLEKALADGTFAAASIKHTEQQKRWFQRSA
jgi:hypothetical protein